MSKQTRSLLGLLLVIIVIALAAYFLTRPGDTHAQSSPSPAHTSTAQLGQPTKHTGCIAAAGLPDRACTPGAVIPTATTQQICVPGYSSGVRNVPDSEKNAVFAEYGITSHQAGEYEVDHLISLELGGSNDIANLWPELASPKPGFHEKDAVENYLHKLVCAGSLSLAEAQTQIASDWTAVYHQLPAK